MHYTKLTDRKDFFIKHLGEDVMIPHINIIESCDKENISNDYLDLYQNNEKRFNLEAEASGPAQYRQLTNAEISLCVKNIIGLTHFTNTIAIAGIFLEDDCKFINGATYENIEHIIYQAPPNWDMIFLGGGFDHNICKYKGRYNNYLLANYPCTNTSSSIIYSQKCAQKLLEDPTFGISWDWHLNYMCKKENMNVYHIYPYIATQNFFVSSIQNQEK